MMMAFIRLSSQLLNQLSIVPRIVRRLRAKQRHQIIELLLQPSRLGQRGLARILSSMESRWPTFFIQALTPASTVRLGLSQCTVRQTFGIARPLWVGCICI